MFEILWKLKFEGILIFYISYKFEEICVFCDYVMILWLGKNVGECVFVEILVWDMVEMMVGDML